MERTKITEATEQGQKLGDIQSENQNATGTRLLEVEEEMLAAGWKKDKELVKGISDSLNQGNVRTYILGDRMAMLSNFRTQDGINVLIELEGTLKNEIKEAEEETQAWGTGFVQRMIDFDADYVFNTMCELGWHKIDSVPQTIKDEAVSIQEQCYYEKDNMYAVAGRMRKIFTRPELTTAILLAPKDHE